MAFLTLTPNIKHLQAKSSGGAVSYSNKYIDGSSNIVTKILAGNYGSVANPTDLNNSKLYLGNTGNSYKEFNSVPYGSNSSAFELNRVWFEFPNAQLRKFIGTDKSKFTKIRFSFLVKMNGSGIVESPLRAILPSAYLMSARVNTGQAYDMSYPNTNFTYANKLGDSTKNPFIQNYFSSSNFGLEDIAYGGDLTAFETNLKSALNIPQIWYPYTNGSSDYTGQQSIGLGSGIIYRDPYTDTNKYDTTYKSPLDTTGASLSSCVNLRLPNESIYSDYWQISWESANLTDTQGNIYLLSHATYNLNLSNPTTWMLSNLINTWFDNINADNTFVHREGLLFNFENTPVEIFGGGVELFYDGVLNPDTLVITDPTIQDPSTIPNGVGDAGGIKPDDTATTPTDTNIALNALSEACSGLPMNEYDLGDQVIQGYGRDYGVFLDAINGIRPEEVLRTNRYVPFMELLPRWMQGEKFQELHDFMHDYLNTMYKTERDYAKNVEDGLLKYCQISLFEKINRLKDFDYPLAIEWDTIGAYAKERGFDFTLFKPEQSAGETDQDYDVDFKKSVRGLMDNLPSINKIKGTKDAIRGVLGLIGFYIDAYQRYYKVSYSSSQDSESIALANVIASKNRSKVNCDQKIYPMALERPDYKYNGINIFEYDDEIEIIENNPELTINALTKDQVSSTGINKVAFYEGDNTYVVDSKSVKRYLSTAQRNATNTTLGDICQVFSRGWGGSEFYFRRNTAGTGTSTDADWTPVIKRSFTMESIEYENISSAPIYDIDMVVGETDIAEFPQRITIAMSDMDKIRPVNAVFNIEDVGVDLGIQMKVKFQDEFNVTIDDLKAITAFLEIDDLNIVETNEGAVYKSDRVTPITSDTFNDSEDYLPTDGL